MFSTWARNVREMRGGKRGRNPVFSSAKGYPMAIEREFAQYLRKVLMELVERMTEAALSGLNVAQDDLSDLNGGDFPLPADFRDRVKSFGTSLELFSRQRMAEESFMIVGERYIPGAVKEKLIGNWCENMQVLCNTTTAENKAKISQIVGQGVARGENLESIKKEINKVVPEYTKNHTELVARTEIGKLNGAIKRAQYGESGIEYYKWMSGRDDRVRPTHAAMNGVICSLTDPDVYYEETPEGLVKHQRTGSMVHLHPGDDFQCRCTMVMWDPEIDGKYEVKETPKVEQEKKPTALELEREKTAKAEAELEKARAEKAEAERRAEILQKANERHAKRTPKDVDLLKSKWWKRSMPKDLTESQKEQMAQNWLEIERIAGVNKGAPMSIEEADKQSANPNYRPKSDFSANCATCVPTYMLRMHGFDFKAKGRSAGTVNYDVAFADRTFSMWTNLDGGKPDFFNLELWMSRKGYTRMSPKRYVEFFEAACKDVGVYELSIGLKNDNGHAAVLQRLENGKLVYIEPQVFYGNGFHDVLELANEGALSGYNLSFRGIMRIDNKILNTNYIELFDK